MPGKYMIILLDLDGTLTDTAHERFKSFKDGVQETEISEIPVFPGSREFISQLLDSGHKPIIISDSHPKYVNKIARLIFKIPAVNLSDKPNVEKTLKHINSNKDLQQLFIDKDNYLMVGDSWLDIELGRRLNIRTVLTQFYHASSVEERDGIGQDWKPVKMGPTYFAKTFGELTDIIEHPLENLFALEAIFQGANSSKAVPFLDRKYHNGFTAFRCLARQNDGECDKYARADKYYMIDKEIRSEEFLNTLAQSVTNYIQEVVRFKQYAWHYLTYVSDKKTTTPPNKMKEIFDRIKLSIPKKEMFYWDENVTGSLRNQPNYETRRKFISNYFHTSDEIEIKNKNIIVIDDQFTSSATANEISSQLRSKGANNILFIALFYLILPIESKACPNVINEQVCGKPLRIKIRKNDGNKFYSCLPVRFGGQGCGYTENIRQS
jgi:phosphoglycolate phosphatase-like HAD superfamily hydrolase